MNSLYRKRWERPLQSHLQPCVALAADSRSPCDLLLWISAGSSFVFEETFSEHEGVGTVFLLEQLYKELDLG